MSIYTDVRDIVYTWTTRTDMTAETDAAISNAVRAAHRAAKFWRDLVSLPLTSQPTDQIQQIDLSSVATNIRRVGRVYPTGNNYLEYKEHALNDLFDADGYPRTNIYWMIGTTMHIRADAPSSDLTIQYYKHPTVSPIASLDSWIAQMYSDYIGLAAAATVLAMVNEPEVKTRVEKLADTALENLIADNLTVAG